MDEPRDVPLFPRWHGGLCQALQWFFTALAVIPPWGEAESLRELERCRYELGMKAIQLSTHYGELYLDDSAFAPLFENWRSLG